MSSRPSTVVTIIVCCCALAATLPGAVWAGGGNWWDVEPEEENPSPYYDSILYSEIAPRLREIELTSNRVSVEVLGQSAGGRNLFLVTIADPQGGGLGKYNAIRNKMLKDPAKAQQMADKFGDFKVPVLINAGIHGTEYPAVDATIRMLETLAYAEGEDIQAILDNVVLLINVVHNADGRVLGTRRNANGFDIDHDFITQSQPETRAVAELMRDQTPLVVLDLHATVNPCLIEPATPPHNPNYEYDLYIKWAYPEALAMEAELVAQTPETQALIPYRDWALGWDDWAPIYTAMYAMYHGAYAHTIEAPYRDERGVDGLYAAVWGALEYVAQNRLGMLHDQIEIFRRGSLDLPQQAIPPSLLPVHDQYPDLMIQDFPTAYIVPNGPPFQPSEHQPARLVDHLLDNGVEVEKAKQPFSYDGVDYPKGTYVVWLDQPRRGLANTLLDDGLDLSDIPGLTYFSAPSAWGLPRLWGAHHVVVDGASAISTKPVNTATSPTGSLQGGAAVAYAYLPTSLAAIQATNELLADGVTVYRKPDSFSDSGRDFGAGAFIIPGDAVLATELVEDYALDIIALGAMPADAVLMEIQTIAVYGAPEVAHCLEVLGFDYDTVTRNDLNAGDIAGYDVFLNQELKWSDLSTAGQSSFSAWFTAGGDYVGLGHGGDAMDFAVGAGIITATYSGMAGSALVEVDFDPDDTVAAGYADNGSAFMNNSVWFNTVGAGTEVSASLASDDFVISGYWPGWSTSGAEGMPIVVHASSGDQDTVLIGFDPTFRGMPEDSFRMVANAIHSGLN